MPSADRERLILLCRWRSPETRVFVERARGLVIGARATGGALVAWSSTQLAVAWPKTSFATALELATALRNEAGLWSCSMALGDLETLEEGSTLGGGDALGGAEVLAAAARPSELWAHESVLAAFPEAVRAGTSMAIAWTGREVQGALVERPRAPLPPPRSPSQAVIGRASVNSASSFERSRSPAMASAPTIARPPSMSGSAPALAPALAPVAPAPTQPRYRSPSTFDVEEVDPEALALRLAQLSRDALLDGDAASLEKWSDGLKATGEKDALAERMWAMARLAKGRVGDALKALRAARLRAEEEGQLRSRCQAALALGVGLAFAGRSDEALLEGLDALARAREAADAQAEGACLAFLQKLFTGKHPSVFPPKEAEQSPPKL